LLHSSAYYNTFKIAELILAFFKKRFGTYLRLRYLKKHNLPRNTQNIERSEIDKIKEQVKKVVEDWINYPSKGEEGFYPLHFASFHGNVKLLKLLIQNGANINARNKQGINMLHVAAQGD